MKENAIDKHLYSDRKEFCIIALTGITGSGYKELTHIMEMTWDKLKYYLRAPEHLFYSDFNKAEMSEIDDSNKEKNYDAIARLVQNRKYAICYNYMQEHYTNPYEIIKYNKVLWLYTLKYIITHNGNDLESFKNDIFEVLDDKYASHRRSYEDERVEDRKYLTYCEERKKNGKVSYLDYRAILNREIDNNLWHAVLTEIDSLPCFIESDVDDEKQKQNLNNIFFSKDSAFSKWYNNLNHALMNLDYYCSCFLYHRLGMCLRTMGNPLIHTENNLDIRNEHEHLFDVVKLISTLIKIHHKQLGEKPCRVCIDALYNSFEAKYLQERFTAFYFMTVNTNDYESNVSKAIEENMYNPERGLYDSKIEEDQEYFKKVVKYTLLLGSTEAKSGIKSGELAAPDLENCVANAEIHLTFLPTPEKIIQINKEGAAPNNEPEYRPLGFHYLAEQWMKYACLIQHPGLITPSTDERCMEIAYTAKFNSGCISRQVGAAITNKFGSIRTIGWNDVPYGQMPCFARDFRDLYEGKEQNPNEKLKYIYSEFELGNNPDVCVYKHEKCFRQRVCENYAAHIDAICRQEMKGLPFPFCFREHHTSWLSKEKGNQFHQRAIHAEENAMMQMVKYGGEALNGGIIYVTASPCEICSKKLYQIGVRKIVYIDPYPGIARKQIISSGYRKPELITYQGAYGATYYKLFMPFMSYKDEIHIRTVEYGIELKEE